MLGELATALCELLWHEDSTVPPRILFAYEERLPLEEQRFLDQLAEGGELFGLCEVPKHELDFSEVDAAASNGDGDVDDDGDGVGGLGALFFQRPPLRLFWITRGKADALDSISTALRDLQCKVTS